MRQTGQSAKKTTQVAAAVSAAPLPFVTTFSRFISDLQDEVPFKEGDKATVLDVHPNGQFLYIAQWRNMLSTDRFSLTAEQEAGVKERVQKLREERRLQQAKISTA